MTAFLTALVGGLLGSGTPLLYFHIVDAVRRRRSNRQWEARMQKWKVPK